MQQETYNISVDAITPLSLASGATIFAGNNCIVTQIVIEGWDGVTLNSDKVFYNHQPDVGVAPVNPTKDNGQTLSPGGQILEPALPADEFPGYNLNHYFVIAKTGTQNVKVTVFKR